MGTPRKSFHISKSDIALIAEQGHVSEVGRGWIEDFLENGTDYIAPEMGKMQVVIDPEVVAAAERKARAEYGVGLTEIIRHKIAALRRGSK